MVNIVEFVKKREKVMINAASGLETQKTFSARRYSPKKKFNMLDYESKLKAAMNIELPKFFTYRQTDDIEDMPGFNDAVCRMEDVIHEQVKQEIEREKEEIIK